MANHLFLNKSVRLVGVQFNFSNPSIIPPTVQQRRQETIAEQRERKNRPNDGMMVIKPIDSVSIKYLVKDLEVLGYELVDGFSQERPHPKRRDQTYFTVRFVFAQREYAEVSDEFDLIRSKVRQDLIQICNNAFWKTSAFVNPFYIDGEQVDGIKTANFNFTVRTPLFNPDGSPVMARLRDENGKQQGEPVPITALHKMIRGKKMLKIVL